MENMPTEQSKLLVPPREIHPVFDRLILAPSGASKMFGGEMRDAPGIHRVISAHSSAYLVPINAEKTEFILIDAGMDVRARNIKHELGRIGHGLAETAIKAIFVTHGHRDHTAGLSAFPNAEIFASKEDARYIEGQVRADGPLGKVFGKLPEKSRPQQGIITIENGDKITIGDYSVIAYSVPGHTEGSMAYVIGNNLFIGDAMFFNKDGGVSLPPAPLSHNMARAAESLIWLVDTLDEQGQEISTVIPSHSGSASMDMLRQWRDMIAA